MKMEKKMGKKIEVNLPVRINFGGAWSDTPPFCINEGGCVCNASVLINGENPVKVNIEEINENKIILENEKEKIEITRIEKLEEIDKQETFALAKVILDFVKVKKMNFKLVMQSADIPRGSGLGTSSILSLAILKAIYQFENRNVDEQQLINEVLEIEKRIGTGGGWQDQAGAIKKGIKLITSNPGDYQNVKINEIVIPKKTKKEIQERLVLIYTGETRNSKDIVQNIMKKYQNEIETKKKIIKLKEIAREMKNVLESGDIDTFSDLLNKNYEISKTLNDKIENQTAKRIFEVTNRLTSR